MHLAISRLTSMVSPPSSPCEIGTDTEWARACKIVGMALPDDYRNLCMLYGSGAFVISTGWVLAHIINPFSRWYRRRLESVHRVFQESKQIRPKAHPYEFHPTSPGLLCWGTTENRGSYFWYTDGKPNEWPVVFHTADLQYVRHDMSLSGFLVNCISGDVTGWGADRTGKWFRDHHASLRFKPDSQHSHPKVPCLHEAIMVGDIEKTQELLDQDCNVDERDESGETPLLHAVTYGDVRLMRLLIDHGADPNIRPEDGSSALLRVCSKSIDLEGVQVLLSAGADIEASDEEGFTPLHHCLRYLGIEKARALIEAGANVNALTHEGKSPLGMARRDPGITKMLVEAGDRHHDA